jgi:oxygen-independent coproporphyrinogen-3 oxidase
MDSRFLLHAQRNAPRYTSYPSAPHFNAGVGALAYGSWLADLEPGAALSLYLHVPYCRQICWYCGCNTYAARRGDTVADFVDTVRREIDLVAETTPARAVRDIHWGGGTPNILSPAQFTRIWRHVAFWFDIEGAAAHAVEADPRALTPEHAAAYASAGVTRVSLGVQDFNAHVQRHIGREQPAPLVEHAVSCLRGAGIDHISMDLMYGLPAQTEDDLLVSLRTAAAMTPQRIALFGYAHVPWFKKRQRLIDEELLPSVEARFDQAKTARAELTRLGYLPIGLDHFCLPGDELACAASRHDLHRNFQGYVANTTSAILGFGPSAISTLPQGYVQNHHQPGVWARSIHDEKLPIARGHSLSRGDKLRRSIIERLMCDFVADLSPFGGAAAFAQALDALAPLEADGLVAIDGDLVTIPPEARPFCRLAAQAFDAYAQSPARHSGAI